MSQNHYQVLGVPPTAPTADIKRAYRRLATELHPDKHGGDRHYEELFKAVAVAYGVLANPDRRAQYDFQLQLAERRAQEMRRASAEAGSSGPSVYKMPEEPRAAPPLRTRSPAGSRERHYQPRVPRRQARFNRQDFWLVAGLMGLIILFSFSAKMVMDRVTANGHYEEAQQELAAGQWGRAFGSLNEVLNWRPGYAPALLLRGQLSQDSAHNLRAARADYEAALTADDVPLTVLQKARLFYRLGLCQVAAHQPTAAELNYGRALALDTTLAEAYLARGENRLLNLGRPDQALADLRRGHRQYNQYNQADALVPLNYLQAEGAALTHFGRYPEARAVYELALNADIQDGRTLFLLGRLAQQQGDSASGCEFFRRGAKTGYSYAVRAAENCR